MVPYEEAWWGRGQGLLSMVSHTTEWLFYLFPSHRPFTEDV